MNYSNGDRYVGYGSEKLCVTFDKYRGSIGFLGLDSGGRITDRATTDNELKPGYGIRFGGISGKNAAADCNNNSFRFSGGDTEVSFEFSSDDESFVIAVTNPEDDAMEFFFDISVGMPTIWAERNIPRIEDRKKIFPENEHKYSEAAYSFPLIIHFPDHGRMMIDLLEGDADCHEELIMSESQLGLSLGYLNFGHHTRMNALHHGYSHLTFRNKKSDILKFKVSVLEEAFPVIPFDNWDSPIWNGLKRCWLNMFTLERNSYSMGDNIALGGIAHLVMHIKSDFLQFIDGMEEQGGIIRSVLERAVELTFEYGQAEDGEISWEYIDEEKPDKPICAFIDTTPSAVISLAGIDNWKDGFAKPYLAQAKKACDFLISLDTDGDGIIEVPSPGTSFEEEENLTYDRPRNWWDNIAFGYKDIYFNILSHRAIRHTVELAKKYGDEHMVAELKPFLAEFEKNFFDIFYNDSTGVLSGWVDCEGHKHDYMFTFATSMAINEGLVDRGAGRRMLEILLDKMEEQGFGDLRYGIPGNVLPVAPKDTFDWGVLTDWKRYENGGPCGHAAYPCITSLYLVGMEAKADEILKGMLEVAENEPTFTGLMPGYGKSFDWRTPEGNSTGFNYLADQYYYLLSVYTGKAKMKHPSVVDLSFQNI